MAQAVLGFGGSAQVDARDMCATGILVAERGAVRRLGSQLRPTKPSQTWLMRFAGRAVKPGKRFV